MHNYKFAHLRKNICFAYKSWGAKVNTCCRFYEVFEIIPDKLCDSLTLQLLEI